MKRHKMNRNRSRKHFTRNAMNVKKINYSANPMRGGIRL